MFALSIGAPIDLFSLELVRSAFVCKTRPVAIKCLCAFAVPALEAHPYYEIIINSDCRQLNKICSL